MLAHLLIAAAMAAAPAPSGLDVKVRASDPMKPVVVLTNSSGKPCQVVNTALGTVALTSVTQDGKAIAPIPMDVGFLDRVDSIMTERLQTLEPGKSAEIKIPVVKAGPTGQALEMVTWSDAGPYGSIFPIATGKPLTLEVGYSIPLPPDDKTPLCAPGFSTGSLNDTASTGRPKWMVWAAVGVVVLLLLLLVVFLLLRRKKTAAAAVLFLLAGSGMLTQAKPALADFAVDPGLQSAFDNCMATLRAHDPANLLPGLSSGDFHVQIVPTNGDINHTNVFQGGAIIYWDPSDTHHYHGDGNADPCTTLYHEMSHAHQGWDHTWSMDPCATPDSRGRTIEKTEVQAVRDQNLLRRELGMPERGYYGDIPMPTGPCTPPARPKACEKQCGDSNGDPHLLTFDHKRYDFQAVGEFVLTRSAEYQIQVRQQPWPSSRTVAVNTAFAVGMGPDKIEVRMTDAGIVMLVGGQKKPFENGRFGAAELTTGPEWSQLAFDNGPTIFVRAIGIWGLDVAVQPDLAHAGKLEGLLGDFDGDSANDVRPKGGQPIKDATYEALYPSYADSWRIDAKDSLFTYDPGTSTQTYTDRKFPEKKPPAVESLPGRDAAEAVCKRQGVTDPDVLASCILDVALTGQADFARGAATNQWLAGGGDWGGIPFTVRLSKPDDTQTVEFDGTAGQQVFIDIPIATVPSSCGTVNLLGPDGTGLQTGCVINGVGFLDGTKLPTTGKYRVSVTSHEPGEFRLRVITIKDVDGALTADGPPVVVHFDKPGEVGRFTFAGRKDQKVYVDASNGSLPSQCGIFSLRAADGSELRGGCLINGAGELDGTVLPADGTYTVIVDPAERNVGDVTLKLINAIDQHGTIALNGPAVIAKISQPGAAAYFTFTGTAGQKIFVDATDATLTSECGSLNLIDPHGDPTVSGCIINGAGGIVETDGYVLKTTGVYTVILDPAGNVTGQVALKLRG